MTRIRRRLLNTLGTPPPRHFCEFSRVRQAWESVGCATLSGAVTGLALGFNLWLYLATAGIASIGGIPAATQHRTRRGATIRATVGGFVWAAAVLGVHLSTGRAAVTHLPDPLGWYLLLATLPATAVGWTVWTWAHRIRSSRDLATPPSRTASSPRSGVPLPAPVGAAPLG